MIIYHALISISHDTVYYLKLVFITHCRVVPSLEWLGFKLVQLHIHLPQVRVIFSVWSAVHFIQLLCMHTMVSLASYVFCSGRMYMYSTVLYVHISLVRWTAVACRLSPEDENACPILLAGSPVSESIIHSENGLHSMLSE